MFVLLSEKRLFNLLWLGVYVISWITVWSVQREKHFPIELISIKQSIKISFNLYGQNAKN